MSARSPAPGSGGLESLLAEVVLADPRRRQILTAVRELGGLPGVLVAAGLVRNAVWDGLHGYQAPTPLNDVDVVFFGPATEPAQARAAESELAAKVSGARFSVKNLARMHLENGDAPYRSAAEAIAHWPETCTAVGIALADDGRARIAAPHGLDDLFGLRVRATRPKMRRVVAERAREKGWLDRWPLLELQLA